MRPSTIAIIAGFLSLGSSLPLSSTNPTNSTISSVNITQSNTASTGLKLPLDFSGDILDDPLFALLPSLEKYEAIVHTYNKTKLVRRGTPVLPPRVRKLGPKLKDGLPKCWQTCFKNVENKTGGVNILELGLNEFCHNTHGEVVFSLWKHSHVLPCIRRQCGREQKEATRSVRSWLQKTCSR